MWFCLLGFCAISARERSFSCKISFPEPRKIGSGFLHQEISVHVEGCKKAGGKCLCLCRGQIKHDPGQRSFAQEHLTQVKDQRAWEPALFVGFLCQWMLFYAKFFMAAHGDGLTEQQVHHQAHLTGRFCHTWTKFVSVVLKNLQELGLCKAIFFFYLFFRKLFLVSFLIFPCCILSSLFFVQSSGGTERSFFSLLLLVLSLLED